MSFPNSCCSASCPDTELVEVPGVEGDAGTNGTNGVNAYTTLTSDLVIPADGATTAAITVATNAWMSIGQPVFCSDGSEVGTFTVATKSGTTGVTLTFLNAAGDSATGLTINSGGTVSPAGRPSALSAALPTAVDYSAMTTAGAVDNLALAAGVGLVKLTFQHTFIGGTSAVEPVTDYVVGFKFKIISWKWVSSVLLVGAGGSRVANMEIGTTDVGTVPSTITIAIASAAVGSVIAGTAIAGAQTGSATDTISIEIANGGTQFTAGSGTFILTVLNLDTADAIASLSDHVNDLITALTP